MCGETIRTLAEPESHLPPRCELRGQAGGENPRLLGIAQAQVQRCKCGEPPPSVDGETYRKPVIARRHSARLASKRVCQPRLHCRIAQLACKIHRIGA